MNASRRSRLLWLGIGLVVLLAVFMASLGIGAKPLPMDVVIESLFGTLRGPEATIVLQSRLPRALIGIFGGAALGISGALMQTLTRNPLADPGIIGVNAGAGLAVTLGFAFAGITQPYSLFAYSFAGALLTALLVHLISVKGAARPDPLRFVLAGLTVGAMMSGISSAIALLQPHVFDRMRFWMAGSLDVGDLTLVLAAIPLICVGCILALALARSVNALEMGVDTAALLGTTPVKTQAATLLTVALLSGTVTAVTGPIGFVGLMIPYIARWAVGPDLRWMLPFSFLYAAILLLCSDIAGRLIAVGELRVSIVTAFLGAPVLILLARGRMAGRAALR
ncbi:iron complex transport system permease protein [Rhizobium sp. PP-F2F-G38]|uniref:iron chelate uptake ABC transporter family permease subunit n=1 Tax=Rhizobium sp. PP-CC-3G-465 TaxID=2135648 RepID=UPI000D9BCFCB|nr:iron complex transport system permease protein [Rhizobium sp. PP-WC-1G-195]PYE94805.1 iron complex transport system permease protein [Rhizobium sp. PP-F2F-G38]TCQ05376.1 iron complex transport system permease protein [Rhizobium sp. PP-F2F-G36]TCQ26015.1 iron complex transport system permease protein [Rhizobium sp. PP-CC-3G-465]